MLPNRQAALEHCEVGKKSFLCVPPSLISFIKHNGQRSSVDAEVALVALTQRLGRLESAQSRSRQSRCAFRSLLPDLRTKSRGNYHFQVPPPYRPPRQGGDTPRTFADLFQHSKVLSTPAKGAAISHISCHQSRTTCIRLV